MLIPQATSTPIYPEVKPSSPVVEVVKLSPDAQMPFYVRQGDSGISIFNSEDISISPFTVKRALTGIAVMIPPGYEGQIRSRSGLAYREQVFVLNSPGTIDANYRGELGIILASFSHKTVNFPAGSALAQLVISPVATAKLVEVEGFSVSNMTTRGNNAFGSSGLSSTEQRECHDESVW